MKWEFSLVLGPLGPVTEGPIWDGEGLFFTHIPSNRIFKYDPSSGRHIVWRENTNGANGLMLDADGRLYACEGRGHRVVRYEADGSITVIADQYEGKRLNSPNDLAIDNLGRVWFTDPRYGPYRDDMELEHESVYRMDPESDGSWSIHRVTFDTSRPNGLLISPDQKTLYVAEFNSDPGQRRELRAYPITDDGSLEPCSVFYDFAPYYGIDGMCLDSEGNIIAPAGARDAGPGPMIYVFSPAGELLESHPVPEDRSTNCTFGDPDLGTLYITTMGGHLIRAKTGRHGL
ncbi:SMP-30/gluconolactonase/LRE family protein [Thermodesulfobacteriota bacterium]